MNGHLIVSKREIVLFILANLIMFQNPLMSSYSIFRFVDEIIFVICALYLIIGAIKGFSFRKVHFQMMLLILFLMLVGVVGNAFSNVDRSFGMIVTDIIYFTKDFICFIAAAEYFERKPVSKTFGRLLAGETHLILWIAIICLVISQFTNIGMTRGIRYGIKCFRFICKNPDMWSQYCILFLLLLTMELQNNSFNAKRGFYFIILFVVWIASLRSRAFVTISVWLFLMFLSRKINDMPDFYDERPKDKVKHFMKPQYILILGAIALLFGWGQYQIYFGDEAVSARSLLVKGGISIMKDYFPLGSGFGTFGTEVAAQNYSPLYYHYGLNTFWALREGGSELTDCYWPAVAAEMGVIGVCLMVFLVWKFMRSFVDCSRGKKYYIVACLTYIIYLLVSSTVTGIFASGITAGFLFICMAVLHTRVTENKAGYIKM